MWSKKKKIAMVANAGLIKFVAAIYVVVSSRYGEIGRASCRERVSFVV